MTKLNSIFGTLMVVTMALPKAAFANNPYPTWK